MLAYASLVHALAASTSKNGKNNSDVDQYVSVLFVKLVQGLELEAKDIDELFNQWDGDGGGTLDFKELQKVLRPPPGAARPPPTLQKRASAKG